MSDLNDIYTALMANARASNFAGWDPFDGLESRIFQATPLRHLAPARVAWLQMIKRTPWNLRPMLLIPKGVNPKGIALFRLAELAHYRTDPSPANELSLDAMLDSVSVNAIENASKGTLAYGYNFDWQSRAFFAPKATPTIVPTAFAARAIYETWELKGGGVNEKSLVSIARFIMTELNRPHETEDEVCFSYTPIDNSKIYNASLLSAEVLANVGKMTGQFEYTNLADKAVRFVLNGQRPDGSWLYGPGKLHGWVDNFHTAFILDSLHRIASTNVGLKHEIDSAIARGFDYWLDNFFLEDGTPKYFDRQTYPVDIHSAAAAIVALSRLASVDERALPLAAKVADWTVREMWSGEGYFYYQKRRLMKVRTPFIRWGQAWMAYALASLMEARAR